MATSKRTKARARTAPAAKRAKGSKKTAPARKQASGLSLSSVAPSFTVNDLDKSLAFYGDVLGFVVKERWESEGKLMGVEMAAGRVLFMLSQDDWKKGKGRVKGEGFRLFAATTQDVDRLAEQVKARGGSLAHGPSDEPWGARSITVEDPDGFKITIFSKSR